MVVVFLSNGHGRPDATRGGPKPCTREPSGGAPGRQAGDSACWQTAHRAQAAAPRRILHRSDQPQPPAKGQEKRRQRSPGQRPPPVARLMTVAVGSARALPPACRRAEPRALPLSAAAFRVQDLKFTNSKGQVSVSVCKSCAQTSAAHRMPRALTSKLPAPRCPP